MKRYKFVDLDGTHILTEEEILDQYFEWWCAKMRSIKKLPSSIEKQKKMCIEDFCIVNWADEF